MEPSSLLPSFFGDDEMEVSDILLSLPNLIHESESHRFQVQWGAKRRRSGIDSSPSPSLQKTCTPQGESETERRPKVKVKVLSPSTPLSFSPSESDDKSNKHSRTKVSKKRTREEWLEIIDGLVQRREILTGEIENVKSYYKKLKASNFKLKTKKQEVSFCLDKSQLEKLKYGMELSQHTHQPTQLQNQDHSQIRYMAYQQPCIGNQTAYGSQTSENIQYPYAQISTMPFGSELDRVNHMGSLCIPDLNLVVEETFGMDPPQPLNPIGALIDNKARAAEARRRRIIRIKEMRNSFATIKRHR